MSVALNGRIHMLVEIDPLQFDLMVGYIPHDLHTSSAGCLSWKKPHRIGPNHRNMSIRGRTPGTVVTFIQMKPITGSNDESLAVRGECNTSDRVSKRKLGSDNTRVLQRYPHGTVS